MDIIEVFIIRFIFFKLYFSLDCYFYLPRNVLLPRGVLEVPSYRPHTQPNEVRKGMRKHTRERTHSWVELMKML